MGVGAIGRTHPLGKLRFERRSPRLRVRKDQKDPRMMALCVVVYAESRGFEPPPTSQPMSRFSRPGGHPLVHTFQSGERWIRTTVPLTGGHRFSKPDAPSYTRTLQRWTTSQRLSTPVSPLREHGPPSGGNGSRTRERRLMRPMRDRRAVPLCVRLRWEARTYTLPRVSPGNRTRYLASARSAIELVTLPQNHPGPFARWGSYPHEPDSLRWSSAWTTSVMYEPTHRVWAVFESRCTFAFTPRSAKIYPATLVCLLAFALR